MTLVTVLKGNVVTPKEVLYGGHVVVVGETIVGVFDSATPLPTKEGLAKQYSDPILNVVDGGFILPGFVDIHNHGLGGYHDVIGHWTNPEYSLRELARCGTLATLASLIFSDDHKDVVAACVEAVRGCVGKYMEDCCDLGGIHAEGPVIHDRGGLPLASNRMSQVDFEKFCSGLPSLKVMTISPHVDAATGFKKIKHLLDIGVRPSLGHDRVATKAEIMGALRLAPHEADKMHVTHWCNVMTFHHRTPSLTNVSLCSKFPKAPVYRGALPPTVEIIGDLVHLDAITLQSALLARSPDDVALISDCISEYKPGKHFDYNGRTSIVRAEGGCYLCDSLGRPSSTMAGGTSVLSEQFYSLVSLFGVGIVEAVRMTATTPARIARLHEVGSIAVGKRANLLLLSNELTVIEKRMVWGRWTSHGKYPILRPPTAHM